MIKTKKMTVKEINAEGRALAVIVDVDLAAIKLDAEATHEAGRPRFAGHFSAVGIEPGNLRRLGSLNRLAMEEAAAVKYRLRLEERDDAACELEQRLLIGL